MNIVRKTRVLSVENTERILTHRRLQGSKSLLLSSDAHVVLFVDAQTPIRSYGDYN